MGKLNQELRNAIPFNVERVEKFGEKFIIVSGKYDDVYEQSFFIDNKERSEQQTNAIIEEAKNIITNSIENSLKC